MALIYSILSASLCGICRPHLDLNHFLHDVSVGEAQLHKEGSLPRGKAQVSTPLPPLAQSLLASAVMLG